MQPTPSAATSWTEIKVAVPVGWHELVADALAHTLCTTVQIGDHSIASDTPADDHVHLRSYVPTTQDSPGLREELAQQIKALSETCQAPELQALELQYKALPPEDYANSWRKSWKAFRLRRGERSIVLHPPWETPALAPSELAMVIEPGAAFGSGRHATTRTCLALAIQRINGGESVLDAGCGSGILGVGSLLLGATSCSGFDIDPIAARCSQDLADSNGVGARSSFEAGGFEILSSRPEQFDVVFANIYADIIQEHIQTLKAALKPTGWFAFSGCAIHHREDTHAAILEAGLQIDEVRQLGRWATFVGRLPA